MSTDLKLGKTDLIDQLAETLGVSKVKAKEGLDGIFETIQKTVKKGGDVQLIGFGTFSQTKRGARAGRNPQTGETIKIKASKAIKFTAGKQFKDMVNGR